MATYLALVNELLRRINETTLDTAGDGFGDARNLQAIAKDAINSSTREILQVSQVDWDTFYLKKLTSADNEPKLLPVIKYEDYLRYHRPQEDSSGASGRTVPTTVYQTQERKFGVTPVPDAAYEIEYRYWSFPSDLVAFDDTSIIPDRFKHVLIDGAMMYMMIFRSNEQSAALHKQKFDDGIDTMRRLLLDEPRYVSSTIISRRAFNRFDIDGR
jgi:hypothetical protein